LAEARLIRAAATVLYGPQPALGLSEGLGVNTRTVQRWLAGQNAVPAGIWRQLFDLAAEREAEITELRAQLAEKLETELEE
jgi:hypothetical protein